MQATSTVSVPTLLDGLGDDEERELSLKELMRFLSGSIESKSSDGNTQIGFVPTDEEFRRCDLENAVRISYGAMSRRMGEKPYQRHRSVEFRRDPETGEIQIALPMRQFRLLNVKTARIVGNRVRHDLEEIASS